MTACYHVSPSPLNFTLSKFTVTCLQRGFCPSQPSQIKKRLTPSWPNSHTQKTHTYTRISCLVNCLNLPWNTGRLLLKRVGRDFRVLTRHKDWLSHECVTVEVLLWFTSFFFFFWLMTEVWQTHFADSERGHSGTALWSRKQQFKSVVGQTGEQKWKR